MNALNPLRCERKNLWSKFIWIGLVILNGCSSRSADNVLHEPSNEKTISVVTTIGMLADIVREFGGEHVSVTQLMGPGVDPHLYKPNRDDIQSILDCDLVFYAGHHLEGKMAATLEKIKNQKPIIALSERLDDKFLILDDQSQVDPHLWMDVSLWTGLLDPIAAELQRVSPEHSGVFESNSKMTQQRLMQLHQYGLNAIASIPESQRTLITSHDAFRYFGRAYNLEVLGVQGISTESEAGLQRINELVDMITLQQIPAIFIESSVPQKNIDSLIEGSRARGHSVSIGGELYSDAMGESGTPEGTYLGMMAHNIKTVTKALGGSAKEFPLVEHGSLQDEK